MKLIVLSLLLIGTVQQAFSDYYYTFTENGKVGLKNGQGTVLVPAQYDALGWSNGQFSVVENVTGYKLNDQWGLISIANQQVTKPVYNSLIPAPPNLFIASRQSSLSLRISTGCINALGKIIIPFQYAGMRIHNSRAVVYTLDGGVLKYGLIDLNHKLLIPQVYQNIYPLGSLRFGVQNFQQKTALFSENGKQLTPFDIDSLSPLQNDLAVIYKNGKQGLMNREGMVIQEPTFREIKLNGGIASARLSNEWHILSASSTLIKKIEADSLLPIGKSRVKQITTAGTRLLDVDFNTVGVEVVSKIQTFHQGLAIFSNKNLKGVLKEDGSVLLPAAFQQVLLGPDYIITRSQNLGKEFSTLYSLDGKPLTHKSYDQIDAFNGSFYPVRKNNFYGGVDRYGKEIMACTYDSVLSVYEDLAVVKFRGAYGIINLKEEWKITPQPNRLKLLNHDRYFEFTENLTFLKSIDGTTIYFTSNPFELDGNTLIETISTGGRWTINLNGQIIHRELPHHEHNEEIFPSSEGLRGIKKNGKYGFIDDLGRLRIANRYEDILPFQEGLAGAKIRGKWGYINKEDKIAIQPVFDEVNSFNNGYALVKQNNKYGLLQSDGKLALEIRYNQVTVQENGRIKISSDTGVGLSDAHGNMLLQPKYDSIDDLGNGYVIVKQNNQYGLVTLQGISTIPLHYDLLLFEPERNVYFGLRKSEFRELKF
ncbi:MAG: WG repeat-containing protein [Cyclobacteriaceae bacterium]|nr:WG repeat-containing protein [Cyclobacteriaceae bacterium]UYN86437.1 MAG: WG repeat-containing protein [Cyclobacteriaceae bacterium]